MDGSSNIVTLASYDTFVGSSGDSTKNYLLSGSGTVSSNQTFNTLKIATTGSGQTLALGDRTLGFTQNGLLFTGADNYEITTSGTGAISGELILHNYGSGVLTLGRMSGSTFEHAGTGKTVLTADSTSSTGNSSTGLLLDSGTLQFSKNSQLVGKGNLRLNSGVLVADTSGGSITLTNDSAGGHRTISLGTDVPVIDVIGGNTLTLGGVISGNYTLVTPIIFGSATSDGTIQVFGNNTYQGDTRLDGGRISVNSSTSFGTNASIYNLVFSRDSILNITTTNATTNITTSRYYNINSSVTGTIETDATTTLTHNGTIAGAGTLAKTGAGTLTLGGTNTHTGGTSVSAGVLKLGASEVLVNSGAVTVAGGTFDLGAFSETVGAVTLASGAITNGTLTGSSYAVQSGSVGAALAGSGVALTKTGSGTVTLTASNTYTGTTTVSDGKLAVNGSIASSAVTVTNAGVLGGSGLVGTTTIQNGGTIAPGNSPGTLSITGNLVWNNGGNYDWEIFNLADSPGTNWDLINVSGSLDLTNLAGPFNINVLSLSGTNTPGALAGFDNTASYAWKILASGAAIGSFSTNKFAINAAGFTTYNPNSGLFALELRNDSKDLYLTYTGGSAIPEPGTWAAAALLAGMAGFMRWRNRRRITA